MLTRCSEKVLVQYRCWRNVFVDVASVRLLHEAMQAERASAGILLATGTYDADAVRFSSGKPMRLVSAHDLENMLRAAKRPFDSAEAALNAR